MKGLILCGGNGMRMMPLTLSTNKHLLGVYNKPMVYYPLATLMLAGIRSFEVVTRSRDVDAFRALLGFGERLGIEIAYKPQDDPSGIVGGILSARRGIENQRTAVILGDNFLFGPSLGRQLRNYSDAGGAAILAVEVDDPRAFGVATFAEDGSIASLEEKPSHPSSNWAVPGLYFFDEQLVHIAELVTESERGELEILDVLDTYRRKGQLTGTRLPRGVMWADMGSPSALHDVASFVRLVEDKQGLLVSSVEEIAYRNEWIDRTTLERSVRLFAGTRYGSLLSHIDVR